MLVCNNDNSLPPPHSPLSYKKPGYMSWFNFGSSQASSSPAAGVNLKLGLREGGVHPSAHLQGGKAGAITPTTPTWDVNKDTDHLFQEHGVEAVKNIEKQTRLDIDQRRVDLRQMVGYVPCKLTEVNSVHFHLNV